MEDSVFESAMEEDLRLGVGVPISNPTDEKPLAEITLADLLQCSPDVLTVSNRGTEGRVSIFETFRRRPAPNHYPNIFEPPCNSGCHGLSLQASKLSLQNTPATTHSQPYKLKQNEVESECDTAKSTKVKTGRLLDLEVITLRSVLEKKLNSSVTPPPKYFQAGRVMPVPTPSHLYHSKVQRRQRRKNLREEMVAEISSTVSHL